MGDFHWQKEICYYNIELIRQGAKNSVVMHRNSNVIPSHKSNIINFRNAPAPTEAITTRVAHVATSAMIVVTFGAVCFASSVC